MMKRSVALIISIFLCPFCVYGQTINPVAVDVINGWDSGIYLGKQNRNIVYADSIDGSIVSVVLAGPVGFEGTGQVKLDPQSVQKLASYYEAWLSGPNPPRGDLRKQLIKAVALARESIGEDARFLASQYESSTVEKISLKLEFPSHVAEFLYENMIHLAPTRQKKVSANGRSESLATKKLSADGFSLVATKIEGTKIYQATFETLNNERARDGLYEKTIAGTGTFAQKFHASMFRGYFHEALGYRRPLPDVDAGIVAIDNYQDFYVYFRKDNSGTSFELVWTAKGISPARDLDSAVANNYVYNQGDSDTDIASENRIPSVRPNSVYRSGSSTFYRGLDGVTREAVRDPTGP